MSGQTASRTRLELSYPQHTPVTHAGPLLTTPWAKVLWKPLGRASTWPRYSMCSSADPILLSDFLASISGRKPFLFCRTKCTANTARLSQKAFLISRTIRNSNHHNTSFSHSAISSFRMCRIWNMKQKGQLYASKWHNRMWLRQLSHTQKNLFLLVNSRKSRRKQGITMGTAIISKSINMYVS